MLCNGARYIYVEPDESLTTIGYKTVYFVRGNRGLNKAKIKSFVCATAPRYVRYGGHTARLDSTRLDWRGASLKD